MIYAILLILLAGQASLPGPDPVYHCDAALAAPFTPPRPAAGSYELCVTPAALDAAILADARRVHAGPVEAVDPLDAFGVAGPYDRSALSRLFGARRARVVHGWSDDERGVTSVTYVSPYPNLTLTALLPGTLVIRYRLENRGL